MKDKLSSALINVCTILTLGVFGFQMAFDDQADVMFNMTLLHLEYVNGTKEKTNCVPFLPENPCRGKSLLWAAILRSLIFASSQFTSLR